VDLIGQRREDAEECRMRQLRKGNVAKEKNMPGNYQLFNDKGKLIYTGSSRKIKNRLLAALYGRADYAQVGGKDKLRNEATHYDVNYMPIKQARKKEKRSKRGCKYNQL